MGPLAKVLIQETTGQAASLDELLRILADNIPDADEQRAFLAKAAGVKAKAAAAEARTQPAAPAQTQGQRSATRTAFTPETLERAEKLLASYVGPLARVLIKDAAGKSGNLKELYSQLAAHIDSEEERRDFLAARPR
jgi:serine/threonine-protein kinase